MNCKPGDLAIITRDSKSNRLAGKVVEVLYLAPLHSFKLPDGHTHDGQRQMKHQDQWVCRFGSPVSAPCGSARRETLYGCVPDRYLRPLRGDLDEDGELETVGADSSDQP